LNAGFLEGYGEKKKKAPAPSGGQNGTEPASKRPKKPPAGRPITNFFKTHADDPAVAPSGAPSSAQPPTHPAIAAVLEAAGAAADSPAPTPTPAEERRRLAAEAALRRMGGAAAGAPHPAPQRQTSPEKEPGGRGDGGGGSRKVTPVIDLVSADGEAGGAGARSVDDTAAGPSQPGGGSGGPGSECLSCPVCGRRWGSSQLTNAQLHQHIDACLAGGA
jgi:hypothetical protein